MLHKDLTAGLLLLALSGGYYAATRQINDSSLSDAVGAAGLPNLLAAVLAFLAAILVIKGGVAGMAARKAAAPAEAADVDSEQDERAPFLRALGFAAIGVGYMIVAPWTGYALGVALLVIAVAVYERERLSAKLVAVATAGGIGFWVIFVWLLRVEQPVSRLLG